MARKKYTAFAIMDDDGAILDHGIMESLGIYRTKVAAKRAGWVLGRGAVVRLVPVKIETDK